MASVLPSYVTPTYPAKCLQIASNTLPSLKGISSVKLVHSAPTTVDKIKSNHLVKSLETLRESPKGMYTWIFIRGTFYADKFNNTFEVYTKHTDLFSRYIFEKNKGEFPEDYEKYVNDNIDDFYAGELEVVSKDEIKMNLLSGTFMYPTMERFVESHGLTRRTDESRDDFTERVNETRFQSFFEKVKSPTYIHYTTATLIKPSATIEPKVIKELVLTSTFDVYFYKSKEECEKTLPREVIRIKAEIEGKESMIRTLKFFPSVSAEKTERIKKLETEIHQLEEEMAKALTERGIVKSSRLFTVGGMRTRKIHGKRRGKWENTQKKKHTRNAKRRHRHL